jgi:hypothetical protein
MLAKQKLSFCFFVFAVIIICLHNLRFSTFGEPARYLAPATIFTGASTASNMSVVVHPSTPHSSEAYISASLFTAGNVARFTVVSKDAFGNTLVDPALKSVFLLLPQSGGDAVIPVEQNSDEIQYQIQSKPVTYAFYLVITVSMQRVECIHWDQ